MLTFACTYAKCRMGWLPIAFFGVFAVETAGVVVAAWVTIRKYYS